MAHVVGRTEDDAPSAVELLEPQLTPDLGNLESYVACIHAQIEKEHRLRELLDSEYRELQAKFEYRAATDVSRRMEGIESGRVPDGMNEYTAFTQWAEWRSRQEMYRIINHERVQYRSGDIDYVDTYPLKEAYEQLAQRIDGRIAQLTEELERVQMLSNPHVKSSWSLAQIREQLRLRERMLRQFPVGTAVIPRPGTRIHLADHPVVHAFDGRENLAVADAFSHHQDHPGLGSEMHLLVAGESGTWAIPAGRMLSTTDADRIEQVELELKLQFKEMIPRIAMQAPYLRFDTEGRPQLDEDMRLLMLNHHNMSVDEIITQARLHLGQHPQWKSLNV